MSTFAVAGTIQTNGSVAGFRSVLRFSFVQTAIRSPVANPLKTKKISLYICQKFHFILYMSHFYKIIYDKVAGLLGASKTGSNVYVVSLKPKLVKATT